MLCRRCYRGPTAICSSCGRERPCDLRHIDLSEFSVALPVVLTVVTIPFSYSIANGIGVGFIAWAVFRSAAGKAREISPLLWIVAAGFLVYFARGWIESLVGI
jgi:AGZA family xanthine/uracil permease-like MFS transporter